VGKIGCPAGNRDDTQRLLVRQFLTNYDFTDRLIIRARWPWRRRSPDSPDGVPKLIPSLGTSRARRRTPACATCAKPCAVCRRQHGRDEHVQVKAAARGPGQPRRHSAAAPEAFAQQLFATIQAAKFTRV
jgi:hypothetical protein